MPTTLKIINYPAANSGESEDRNGMIMLPHPTLTGFEEEQSYSQWINV